MKKAIQQRPNTDKVSNTSQGAIADGKTHLYHTTVTAQENSDLECLDDQVRIGAPSDRTYPFEFETVVDGSSRLAQETNMGHSVTSDPNAPARYGSDLYKQIGEGSSHKGPMMKEHSPADNQKASGWSTAQVSTQYYGSKGGAPIGKSDKGING